MGTRSSIAMMLWDLLQNSPKSDPGLTSGVLELTICPVSLRTGRRESYFLPLLLIASVHAFGGTPD